MLALAPGAVHLWLAHYDRIDDATELHGCLRLLSGAERAQMNRFVFERDRRRYLVTRALVRRTLSRYAPVGASDWQFENNDHGRPEIAAVHRLAIPL
jgi:4'-phosphopantetheinyl transferase